MHVLAALGPTATGLMGSGIIIGAICIWYSSLIDCANREEGKTRAIWLIVLMLTTGVGTVVYFFARCLPRFIAARKV